MALFSPLKRVKCPTISSGSNIFPNNPQSLAQIEWIDYIFIHTSFDKFAVCQSPFTIVLTHIAQNGLVLYEILPFP
jgi:hypothetical protein